jgi:hypothetical protein
MVSKMNDKSGTHLLHISVSNQSFAVKAAELEVKVDGRAVFRRTLVVGTQHNWEQFTVSVASGHCSLEAAETQSNTTQAVSLQVEHDLWIAVTFNSPPPQVGLNVFDKQIGMM